MEVGVPNSFIPHDATEPTSVRRYDSGNGFADLLTLLAIVLFVVSGALAGGSFIYLQYLNTSSSQKQADLKKVEAAFDQSTITTLSRLDSRLNVADTLLSAHIAPSLFFAALDSATLSTVSIGSLDFSEGSDGTIQVEMAGVAQDINSVALQADVFGKSGMISNSIFSGIDQQKDGVHFDVKGDVDPSKISYSLLASGQSSAGSSAQSGAANAQPAAAQYAAPASDQQTQQAQSAQSTTVAPAAGNPQMAVQPSNATSSTRTGASTRSRPFSGPTRANQ